MARGINLLTARTVETIKTEGRYADGGGLYLQIRKRGYHLERLWVFRYKRGGRTAAKEGLLSLGPARDVSLADARALAGRCRAALQRGENPKAELAKDEPKKVPTFGEVADALIKDVEQGFKSEATRANWRRTLGDRYCATLRQRPIDKVDTADVLDVLRPVWIAKAETGRKLRGRIERVLDAAKASGLRQGENPARWKGHLKLMLAAQTRKKGHHRSLPYQNLPEFMLRLRALDSISALALEWTILTVPRTKEAIGTPRAEINREAKVWVIPPERMKEEREHRVPLCNRCIEIFDEMATFSKVWLFPSRDPREHISNMAMAECLRDLGDDATVHGFRSTFRTWIQEETSFPDWMAEAALAHLSGDQVERAYKRGDALKRRRKLMEAWARYCYSAETECNVRQLQQAG
jgi:integrase